MNTPDVIIYEFSDSGQNKGEKRARTSPDFSNNNKKFVTNEGVPKSKMENNLEKIKDELRQEFHREIENKSMELKAVTIEMNNLSANIQGLDQRAYNAETNIHENSTNNIQLLKKIQTLETEKEYLKTKLSLLEKRQDVLEITVRNHDLKFSNFPEVHEDLETREIISFLQKLDSSVVASDIDDLYRIGKRNGNERRARPLIVSFVHKKKKYEILKNKDKFNNEDIFPRPKYNFLKYMYINDDVPLNVNRQRGIMRRIADMAKNDEQESYHDPNAQVKGDYLYIMGKRYCYGDLSMLPRGLTPERVKMVNVTHGIAFQSELCFLSNFYPCSIKIAGHLFTNGEQAYQYLRAIEHDQPDHAKMILKSDNPWRVKEIGDKFVSSEKWNTERADYMMGIQEKKFQQNPDLKLRLAEIVQENLIEASSDQFWGAGCNLGDKRLETGTWSGENTFGKLLQCLRDEYRPKIDEIRRLVNDMDDTTDEDDSSIFGDEDSVDDTKEEAEIPQAAGGANRFVNLADEADMDGVAFTAPLDVTERRKTITQRKNINSILSDTIQKRLGKKGRTSYRSLEEKLEKSAIRAKKHVMQSDHIQKQFSTPIEQSTEMKAAYSRLNLSCVNNLVGQHDSGKFTDVAHTSKLKKVPTKKSDKKELASFRAEIKNKTRVEATPKTATIDRK